MLEKQVLHCIVDGRFDQLPLHVNPRKAVSIMHHLIEVCGPPSEDDEVVEGDEVESIGGSGDVEDDYDAMDMADDG